MSAPRVDFYISANEDCGDRDMLACRLAEKAFQQGHRVYMHTAAADEAARLDAMLWTFAGGSFVPHRKLDQDVAPDAETPVSISHLPPPPTETDVLVNLLPEIPPCFRQFQRIVEPVGPLEPEKVQARARYKHYKEQGITVQSHNIGG